MGSAISKEGDYNAAIDWYNKSIEMKPDYSKSYLNRGLTRELLGMLTEACADWQKAADLGSQEAITYLKECNK
jgi:tetratricopeptide (TPR) repeat protein